MPIKKFKSLALTISNKGIPCLWENGGKLEDESFGQAFIIADKLGESKRPLYIRKELKPNSGHALIPIRTKDVVIVYRIKGILIGEACIDMITTQIYSISEIDIKNKVAYVDIINSFEDDEWMYAYNAVYDKVIKAASKKANTVNCVDVSYVAERSSALEEMFKNEKEDIV